MLRHMIFKQTHHGTTWIDLEHPTPEEIRMVCTKYGVGERIESELLSPTPLPLVSSETEHVLLVLHFPTHTTDEAPQSSQEIDFVVGKHFVITVRYEVVEPLHLLHKVLEADDIMGKNIRLNTDVFLEILFAHLFAAIRDHINHIVGRLEHVEKEMFAGKERKTVQDMSRINCEFLQIEAAVVNHEEPLGRFLNILAQRNIFGPSFVERSTRIHAENKQVARLAATHRAMATELRETNASLLSARQSEIMKTLTLITVLVLPLELLAFIFAIHAPGTPFIDHPQGFWIIISIMLFVVAMTGLFFIKKRWV